MCDNTLTDLPFELDGMLACGNCGVFCGSFRIVLMILSIFFLFPSGDFATQELYTCSPVSSAEVQG